jgi:hypothetical protein
MVYLGDTIADGTGQQFRADAAEPPDTLADHGIAIRHERPGHHRAPCPECRKGKADTALSIKIEADGGATWLCHRCGWKGALGRRRGPQGRDRLRLVPTSPPDAIGAPRASEAAQRAAQSRKALALHGTGLPIVPGTVAADYLAARRCALPHPEGDLRWHPEVRHPSGHVGPALLALVTDAVTCEPLTLHRTWITPSGEKAAVQPTRLLWPGLPKKGGVVRLWPDDEVTLGLCVGEGIETTLSAAHAFQPVWTTVDAGNMAALPVLAGIEALLIVADHDANGGGEDAARTCAERWTAGGVEVRVYLPGKPGSDLNDLPRGTR